MNIIIGSAFRNSTRYLMRYLNQVVGLAHHAGPSHSIRVIAVEGDSQDGTHQALAMNSAIRSVKLEVVKCEHGLPWFGSTEETSRMVALSKVGNAIFEAVRPDDDVLVYVESDLIWDAHTIGSLIDFAMRQEGGFDVFAPLVFAGPHFYDIWGFRAVNGDRFSPFPPYYIGLDGVPCEIGSAGSCLVMRGEVARKCRIRNDYCLVGWCEDARANGYRIAVHPGFKVNHP